MSTDMTDKLVSELEEMLKKLTAEDREEALAIEAGGSDLVMKQAIVEQIDYLMINCRDLDLLLLIRDILLKST